MSNARYPEEWVDDRLVPPRFIESDTTITEAHRGGIVVRIGATLTLAGAHQGSLTVETGGIAVVAGGQQGSIHVAKDATLVVRGGQQGSISVEAGGLVQIEASGHCQGTLHVDGRLENRGARGGPADGSGEVSDEPGSRVVSPIQRGDALYYEW